MVLQQNIEMSLRIMSKNVYKAFEYLQDYNYMNITNKLPPIGDIIALGL